MQSVATIATVNGSKYLQQLCKHWSHKLEVEYDAERGRVNFESAAVHFTAATDQLVAVLTGPDTQSLERLEPVVSAHLQRFAFRETLAVEWMRGE